ncbi:C-type lectin domain family 2 member D-like [Sceloporus undulatus]|uniref:C-type lectin domain family 2 member D-like n=1 Tax=Sceloporus undulatus TaxID=8520 RepID=UPI001C4C795E|nr:C-type lectin domain family 2 member D-like [Sceloporus undulatus]
MNGVWKNIALLRYCTTFMTLTLCDRQEKSPKTHDFVMHYKGKVPSWIGFKKDPDQLWQWINGENTINLKVIGKGGNCAYLNSEGTATASRCSTELLWICNKPDVCNRSNGV